MKQLSIILQICRFSLAGIWIYQGLVPKLLGPHADEITMNQSIQPFWLSPEQIAFYAGVGEVLFGVLLFVCYRKKWVYRLTIFAMLGLFLAALVLTPQFVTSAFNAFTLNLACFALAWVALLCLRGNGYEWSFKG